jgi:hypothetical protein
VIDIHYAELLYYQEFEDLNPFPRRVRERIRSLMYDEISTNPFIASVRVYVPVTGQTFRVISTHSGWFEHGPVTPSSLPPSTTQRNLCRNAAARRVERTLQFASDRLMIEFPER